MDTMYFSWLDSPVDIDKDLQLPQFTLEDKILYDCSQNYTAGHVTYIYDELLGWFIGSTVIGDTPWDTPEGYPDWDAMVESLYCQLMKNLTWPSLDIYTPSPYFLYPKTVALSSSDVTRMYVIGVCNMK